MYNVPTYFLLHNVPRGRVARFSEFEESLLRVDGPSPRTARPRIASFLRGHRPGSEPGAYQVLNSAGRYRLIWEAQVKGRLLGRLL